MHVSMFACAHMSIGPLLHVSVFTCAHISQEEDVYLLSGVIIVLPLIIYSSSMKVHVSKKIKIEMSQWVNVLSGMMIRVQSLNFM